VHVGGRSSATTSDRAQRGEPIVLGIEPPPIRASAVPLWAGPVRVEPGSWSMPTTSSASFEGPVTEITSLLSRILESWWRS
jgi:hypothetical protein